MTSIASALPRLNKPPIIGGMVGGVAAGIAGGIGRSWGARIATALVPPLCPLCDSMTLAGGRGLCATCWQGLHLLGGGGNNNAIGGGDSTCRLCAVPFAHGGGAEICPRCALRPPEFDGASAAMLYDDTARALVLALKHGSRLDVAPVLAGLMLAGARDHLARADIIIPVPLHRRRFFARRFNQSAEIARHLLRRAEVDMEKFRTGILHRTRATPSQGRMTRNARRKNLRGAFAVAAHHRGDIKGKNIVLVDDVLTTGATLDAAARACKKAGANSVVVAVAARVAGGVR